MHTKKARIQNGTMDMTEGRAASLLLRFTIPLLAGNVFQQFYNLVDSIVAGRFVGSNELLGLITREQRRL